MLTAFVVSLLFLFFFCFFCWEFSFSFDFHNPPPPPERPLVANPKLQTNKKKLGKQKKRNPVTSFFTNFIRVFHYLSLPPSRCALDDGLGFVFIFISLFISFFEIIYLKKKRGGSNDWNSKKRKLGNHWTLGIFIFIFFWVLLGFTEFYCFFYWVLPCFTVVYWV